MNVYPFYDLCFYKDQDFMPLVEFYVMILVMMMIL